MKKSILFAQIVFLFGIEGIMPSLSFTQNGQTQQGQTQQGQTQSEQDPFNQVNQVQYRSGYSAQRKYQNPRLSAPKLNTVFRDAGATVKELGSAINNEVDKAVASRYKNFNSQQPVNLAPGIVLPSSYQSRSIAPYFESIPPQQNVFPSVSVVTTTGQSVQVAFEQLQKAVLAAGLHALGNPVALTASNNQRMGKFGMASQANAARQSNMAGTNGVNEISEYFPGPINTGF